ncbi:MAG: Hsp20/alpha crystallin family protein [Candidatus Paceibacterota bacterium]|jgi:HSP20 family protein
MSNNKRSFFERLTGSMSMDDEDSIEINTSQKSSINGATVPSQNPQARSINAQNTWIEEPEEAQLTVDIYQTPTEIVVQSMVAGVRPEDIQIQITRDIVTIRGKREANRTITDENYFSKELYWGAFSRTIMLPQEVEPDQAEAVEKHGLLIIRIPKIDKSRQSNLKVKSI